MNDALIRVWRRVLNAMRPGKLTLVNDGGPVQLVQISLGQSEAQDNMPRLAEYGFTSVPPSGSDALALFIAGDRSNGVVIATGNKSYRITGLADGDVAIYDSRGQKVVLTSAGINIHTSLAVTVDAPTLHCTGNITADGDISDAGGAKSMAGMRAAYNSHNHGGGPTPSVSM